MYVFPAGGICTMCSKICDEDDTQGSTFLTDVWLISTQNWITESYWKFNLKKIGRRIGITKKVVLGFAWRVEDYKSWRWLVMLCVQGCGWTGPGNMCAAPSPRQPPATPPLNLKICCDSSIVPQILALSTKNVKYLIRNPFVSFKWGIEARVFIYWRYIYNLTGSVSCDPYINYMSQMLYAGQSDREDVTFFTDF